MKWTARTVGDVRTRTTFVWLPTMCPQTRWVYWLTRVELTERYAEGFRGNYWIPTLVRAAS